MNRRLLTRIGIVFFMFLTTQCGAGCKKNDNDDKIDKRPDITSEMLGATGSFRDLHNMLSDLKAGKPVNVNQATSEGLTLLQCAVYSGNESLVKLLLQEGADVNLEGQSRTPLHCAIISSKYNLSIIKLLLAQPTIDKEKEYKSHTPLVMAINQAYPDAVQALLDAGADYVTPINGKTPRKLAAELVTGLSSKQAERIKIVAILIAKGAPL